MKKQYDVIIAGRQAIDGDTAQVGPQIAEHLGIPQVSYVTDLQYEDGSFKVKRQFEDRYQILRVPSPALFTVLSSAVKPRYMRVKGIMNVTSTSEEEPIVTMTVADVNIDVNELGLKGSPTKISLLISITYKTCLSCNFSTINLAASFGSKPSRTS